jgi:hypothetical protein
MVNQGIQQIVRQHYLPASYLARFTFRGKRDSVFFVHRLNGVPTLEGTPNNEGFERHYHDIDVAGLRPDHLEFEFQKVEEPACSLFKTLSANPGRPFVTKEELETAVFFLAIQAARVPQAKETYKTVLADSGQAFMEKVAHSPEFFDKVTAIARQMGILTESVDQQKLREAVDGGHITVHVDNTHVSIGILRLAYAILDKINNWNCTLLYADGPDWFVCSDYPVGVRYSVLVDDMLEPSALENPTVEFLTSPIYMPLAYNVALVLHQEDKIPITQRADQRMVAIVNTITIAYAERFICSPARDFKCVLPNRAIGNASDAVATLMSFKATA